MNCGYGIINKILTFSAVDGPGNRTAIFFQGCPFNCLYCHNPETLHFCNHCGLCVPVCPFHALSLVNGKVHWDSSLCTSCDQCVTHCPSFSSPKAQKMTIDQIWQIIQKARSFISGVTISGGECTMQFSFLLDLLRRLKQERITTFIDTNGGIPLEKMKLLSLYFDKVMLDIKSMTNDEHLWLTGRPLAPVLANARFLLENDHIHEIRTVVVPRFLDNHRNVRLISRMIAHYNAAVKYRLIPFRRIGVLNPLYQQEADSQLMQELKLIAQSNGCLNVQIQ